MCDIPGLDPTLVRVNTVTDHILEHIEALRAAGELIWKNGAADVVLPARLAPRCGPCELERLDSRYRVEREPGGGLRLLHLACNTRMRLCTRAT